jgi:hypothetical protein
MSLSTTQNVDIESAGAVKSMAGGLPFIAGKWFFVDPKNGSASNDGLTPQTAVDSIVTAYGLCTDGAGDGIVHISQGTTTADTTSYLHAALAWTKSGITVYGVCAPTRFAQRARIANHSTHADLANLITISGNNNAFYNLSFYNGGTTGVGCVKVQGNRNYFEDVHFMGGMGMTTPTIADYDLTLDNATENTFVKCVFGSDTFDKSDIAGTEVIVSGTAAAGGSMRNRFYDCEFISFRSAGTTAGMIKIASVDALNRTLLFDNCFFHMYRDGNATAEVAIVIGSTPSNGFIIFKDCQRHGFVDWAGVATNRVYSASVSGAEAGGITIVCNPS